MERKQPLKFSKPDEEALQHLSDLLHLFHHRNRNQHRRSTWWRHFQVFRKQINSLVTEVKALNDVPTTHLARTKKKTTDPETRRRIEQRRSFWQDVMVSKWQHAFSQVSADGRFAVLGLVLLAALAEACRVIGVTAAFEELGQAEVEKVLDQFAKEGWMRGDDDGDEHNARGEDFGEAISRSPPAEQVDDPILITAKTKPPRLESLSPQVEQATPRPPAKRTTAHTEKTVKRKRRKGNAIDDLFSGVG